MTVRVDFDDDYDGGADGARTEDWWHGLYASTPPDCAEPPFEPSVAAGIHLEISVADAAEFMDDPVLAAAIINGLATVDPQALDYREAVLLLGEASRLASAAEALKAKAVARVCATAGDRVDEEDYLPPAGPSVERLSAMVAESEIRTVLDLSDRATEKLIHHSQLLSEGLPATLDALARGRLKAGQAEVIVDQCGSLPAEAYAGFEAQMVAFAPGRAKHLVADKGRRLREKSHPESIKRRKQKAASDRTVVLEPVEDGMSWLSMYLPAEAATAGFNRLSAVARHLQGPDEGRTLSQLRADVAADLLHAGTGTGHAPAALAGSPNDMHHGKSGRNKNNSNGGTTGDGGWNSKGDVTTGTDGVPVGPVVSGAAGTPGAAPGGSGRVPNYAGIKAEVFVVVPVLTLMGLSDEPADLEGYGPIDEDTARELAINAPSFKRLLTHPETGALLSYGRNRYAVPTDLQQMVRLRDRRCRGVGCNRAARTCELDHSLPYPRGATEESNLNPLCKREHVLKTTKMWSHLQHRNGRVDWTSPAGRKYTTTPDGPLPEIRPVPDITHLLKLAKEQGQAPTAPAKKRSIDGGPHKDGPHKSDNNGTADDPPPF